MKEITFITGNQKKADYLAQYLGFPVKHVKLDVDELQSMDLKVIVEHKVRQAYEKIKAPVLVEDVALEFEALNGLPGPFIKFFLEKMSQKDICALVDGKSRSVIARAVFGYFDGSHFQLFEGSMEGEIAKLPSGDSKFGFDNFFIPKGYEVTRANLSADDDRKTYLLIKPLEKIKAFLESLA